MKAILQKVQDYLVQIVVLITVAMASTVVDVRILKADVKEIKTEREKDRILAQHTHYVTCRLAMLQAKFKDEEKAEYCAGIK